MKLKEEGEQFELLQDLLHLIVDTVYKKYKCLEWNELSYIKYNKETSRYEYDTLHMTLINAADDLDALSTQFKRRNFDASKLIENEMKSLKFEAA